MPTLEIWVSLHLEKYNISNNQLEIFNDQLIQTNAQSIQPNDQSIIPSDKLKELDLSSNKIHKIEALKFTKSCRAFALKFCPLITMEVKFFNEKKKLIFINY